MRLLLLANEKISEDKWYLYTLEIVYQKIIKVVKIGNTEDIQENWRIGYLTESTNISEWPLEDNTYVTQKDNLLGKFDNYLGLMLNKASFPDRIIDLQSGSAYGVIRMRDIEILDEGRKLSFGVWGLNRTCIASISDPWWNHYWKNRYSSVTVERYQNFLSAPKRKVFAVIEKKAMIFKIIRIVIL